MDVLVDTSVWIAFFRNQRNAEKVCDALDYLLMGDEAVVNEVVLTELLPSIIHRREMKIATCLQGVRKFDLEIDWADIRNMQVVCLANGINKVGVPDLIIAQQAVRRNVPLFSLDGHFRLIAEKLPLKLWPN